MIFPMFYCASIPAPGQRAFLEPEESGHALRSRRLKPKQRVVLIDGTGLVAEAVILAGDSRRQEISVEIVSCIRRPRALPRLHLGVSVPKGERQNVLLDMGTQLGMASFTQLICDRSIVKPTANASIRWRKICLQACKQSRQPYLPEIREPKAPEQFVKEMCPRKAKVIMFHPTGKPIKTIQQATDDVALLVGPEGDFTEQEIAAVKDSGGDIMSLGANILRVETAAIVALSYFTTAASAVH